MSFEFFRMKGKHRKEMNFGNFSEIVVLETEDRV